VCTDHLGPWVQQLNQYDGHQLVSQRTTDDNCRAYGLCKEGENR
jgi:hypothetical protein